MKNQKLLTLLDTVTTTMEKQWTLFYLSDFSAQMVAEPSDIRWHLSARENHLLFSAARFPSAIHRRKHEEQNVPQLLWEKRISSTGKTEGNYLFLLSETRNETKTFAPDRSTLYQNYCRHINANNNCYYSPNASSGHRIRRKSKPVVWNFARDLLDKAKVVLKLETYINKLRKRQEEKDKIS